MVRDDPKPNVDALILSVSLAHELRRSLDKRLKRIGVVIPIHTLLDGRDALQAHACVDARLGKRSALAGCRLFELHEHVVPDLDVAVILSGGAAFFVRNGGAMIVVDLTTRAARSGGAHAPEVVLRAEPLNPVLRDAYTVVPQGKGLIVIVEDGDPQTICFDPPDFCEKLPRPGNGIALEVIAEAEVSEHLEERMVTRGSAHVVEIVVLARYPQALLDRGRAQVWCGLRAREVVLKRHHSRVDEVERGVVLGNEGCTRHDPVPLGFEEAEEGLSDLVGCHVGSSGLTSFVVHPLSRPRGGPLVGERRGAYKGRMALICIYRGSGPTDAYLVRHFLEGNDVRVHIRGDLITSRGEIPVAEAWPSVWVPEADQERAERLLKAFHGPRLVHPRWVCGTCGEENEATFEWCWQCQSDAPVV